MSESERRRQQANMGGVIKKGTYSSIEEKQRSIRSANSSPTTHHFLMNGLGAGQNNQNGTSLIHDMGPKSQASSLLVPRPGTSNLLDQ